LLTLLENKKKKKKKKKTIKRVCKWLLLLAQMAGLMYTSLTETSPSMKSYDKGAIFRTSQAICHLGRVDVYKINRHVGGQ
jgi:hypothetical protein